jgi:hypothetical protein
MVAAGYTATEWGMNMPSHVSQMLTDLNERQLRLLGGFVALELRNEAKLTSEIERALELGRFFEVAWRSAVNCRRQWRSVHERNLAS